MAISFDTEGMADADNLTKGFELIPKGHYHCQVQEAVEKESDFCIELKCQILSPGPQCGRTFKERVNFRGGDREKTIKAQQMAMRTAIALSLTTKEEYEADRIAGKPHVVEWEGAAPGVQFICAVTESSFKGRDGDMIPKNEFRIHSIRDNAARGKAVCDPAFLELIEGLDADPPAPQSAAALPPKPAPVAPAAARTAPTPAPASSMNYSDI